MPVIDYANLGLTLTIAVATISPFALQIFWQARDAKRWARDARERKPQRFRDHGR